MLMESYSETSSSDPRSESLEELSARLGIPISEADPSTFPQPPNFNRSALELTGSALIQLVTYSLLSSGHIIEAASFLILPSLIYSTYRGYKEANSNTRKQR